MDDENKISYYAVIPATVRYDKELKPAEKLLYGEVTALANKHGYCYAKNRYFAELYDATNGTVSKWLSHLQQRGYISIEIIRNEKQEITARNIYIADLPYGLKKLYPYSPKKPYPMVKNDKDNNININNIYINNDLDFKTKQIEYAKKVKMTEAEYNDIVTKIGEQRTKELIEKLSLYKQSSGKEYKSDFATILLWNTEDKEKEERAKENNMQKVNASNTSMSKTKTQNYQNQREYPPGFFDNIYANFRMIGQGGENNGI